MRRYKIPDQHAYHDGNRYHCYNIDCFADNATLKEIDRLKYKPTTYIPILRCVECGTTYYGVETYDTEADEERKQDREQREQAEKEREQERKAREHADEEAFIREEARREKAQREECERHQSEMDGDIILPNILTI